MKRQSPLKDFHLVGDWGPGVRQAGYLNKESVPDSLLEKDLTMKCFSKRSCPGTRSSVVMVQLVLVISHTGSRTWYHPCGKWGEECEALFYSHAECKSDSHGTCGANVEMIEFHTKTPNRMTQDAGRVRLKLHWRPWNAWSVAKFWGKPQILSGDHTRETNSTTKTTP